MAFRDLLLRGPDGAEERLDNLRGGAFSRDAPDPEIRAAVARAFGAG